MAVKPRLLRQFQFLRALDDREVRKLASHVQERHYPSGSSIFPDGVVGDMFYLLQKGQVQIVKPTLEGEVILNVLEPGDTFGEMSLLDGEPRSASARSAGEVSVLEIPKEIFLSLIQRFPALLYLTALENAQRLRRSDLELISELRARNQELKDLYDTSLDISRHLDLARALEAITERTRKLLNSTGSVLHLYDSAKHMLVAPSPHTHVRPGEGTTGQAFTSGETVIANANRPKRNDGSARAPEMCELAAPVSLEDSKLGTLTVFRSRASAPFDLDDAQLLRLLANQAAIAIENARLFGLSVEKGRLDGELLAARQVQRSLIPTRAARIPGFQVAGLWRPAHEVAGDFYDFIALGRGRWAVVIGDVSDKGAPAALFMAISRSVIRASAAAEPDAARAIEKANRLLVADAANGMFVTVFFGALDSRSRRLTYVNAGHNPPLMLRAGSGRLEQIKRHGLALGVEPDLVWESHLVQFDKGDMLVLYTDGVTEAFNEKDEIFGEARLARVVKSHPGESAAGLVHAIDHEVNEFAGTRHLADDVTLLAVKAQP